MPGLLLDTHALLWLVNGEAKLSATSIKAIAEAQRDRALFVSPISGWELSVASQKPPGSGRPNLGGRSARLWFKTALKLTEARLAPVTQAITFEAADVPAIYVRKDPGDCFLIATARIKRLPLATRDNAICDLAERQPDCLTVVRC